jgi:hypothetical protein
MLFWTVPFTLKAVTNNTAFYRRKMYIGNQKGESKMTSQRPPEPLKRESIRRNEFLKYLQKRMKELEKEEKKFREIVNKEKKVN